MVGQLVQRLLLMNEQENRENIPSIEYTEELSHLLPYLSPREIDLLNPPLRLKDNNDAIDIKEELEALGFVRFPGGKVLMGNESGLPCSIEGERRNETPPRIIEVPPFYIAKNTITNVEFEQFDTNHTRTNTSMGDRNPVTCITYGRAISYVKWLNRETGLSFCLPTEPQYVAAVAPYGWQYPYSEGDHPRRGGQNHYRAFPDKYPSGESSATLEVDDDPIPYSYLGLNHPTGNVSIFSFGHYPTVGHWGSNTDGSYVVVLGGNFRLCPFGTRSVTRGIVDVTAISDTIGIRLVHPDPEYLVGEL